MSLPTGYGSNHEAVIYHYYHSGSNIYQQQHVLSSFVFAITHSTACISYLIFHERKKEKVFIKSWLSLSRKKRKSAFGQKCSLYPFSPFIFIKRVMVNIISMTSPKAHHVAL